jgi:hypothetical protein
VGVAVTGQGDALLPHDSATTNDDGWFEVTGLPAGRYVVTTERSGGPLGTNTSVERPHVRIITLGPGESREDVALVLGGPGAPISGLVLLPDGKPATSALVRAGFDGGTLRSDLVVRHQAITKDDGSFVIEGLTEGKYMLKAWRTGLSETQPVVVVSGQRDARLAFTESPPPAAVRIAGRAVEKSSGAPVAGARVRAVVRGVERRLEATTSTDGSFEIPGLAPGQEVVLGVSGPSGALSGTRQLRVAAGATVVDLGAIPLVKPSFVGIMMPAFGDRPGEVHVAAGSPAERAGVKNGDRIRAIDGRDVTGLAPGEIVGLLSGEPDTKATLTLEGPSGDRRMVTIAREARR